MDPNLSQQEAPYLSQEEPQPPSQQPNQPQDKPPNFFSKNKVAIILSLSFILILISSITIVVLLMRNNDSASTSSSGEFKEFRKGFTSTIITTPVNFVTTYYDEIDYRMSSKTPNIDDVVQIGCSDWEPNPSNPNNYNKYPVNSLNIVHGVIGRGDFWSVSLIKDDIRVGQPAYFLLYYELDDPKYARAYGFVDFNEYDSGEYNSVGNITVTKFEGCELGNEVEFSINAILGQDDFEEDNALGLQLLGDFKGKVNVVDVNGPYNPLIPQDEFNAYLKKIEDARKKRLEESKEKYLEEYGYDEDYDDYFVDDYYDDYGTPAENNTKRRSDVTQILNAVGAFAADNAGSLPSGIITVTQEISAYGADICSDLVGNYIPVLPVDPEYEYDYGQEAVTVTECNNDYDTGYDISKDAGNRVTVAAPLAESNEIISNTR